MRITCLVDNTVSGGSLWGEHGLAFLIECDGRHVLMDTGASGAVLLHNMEALGLDLGRVEALAISHGHHDHTGGLQALLGRREGLPLYAHPAFGEERVSRGEGRERSIGLPFRLEDLAARADLRLSPEPPEIGPGVWTTGQIRERPEPEGRVRGHLVRRDGTFVDDPYDDDMGLVLERPGGRALLLGCCHAGLLNTLAHVERHFGRQPVVVIGGTHLVAAEGTALQHVIEVLGSAYQPMRLYPSHCTGQRAFVALAHAFGEQVHPCPAGTVLRFD